MIIKSFHARKVHGIYDFNFEFFPDINFLIGINGSGKTSALRLMQAALSIDLFALTNTKFTSLKIEVETDGVEYSLSVLSKPETLIFILNGKEISFQLPPTYHDERRVFSPAKAEEMLEAHRLHFIRQSGSSIAKFMSGARPMFLGLERRLGRYDDDYSESELPREWRPSRTRREILEGLDYCQKLVEKAFKQYRRISDGSFDRLLNIIVESTFEYTEYEPDFIKPNFRSELIAIQQRREEIERFARSIGGSSKVASQIDNFFSKLSQLPYMNDPEGEDIFSVEWLMNYSQLKRIRTIVAELDRQKKSAERSYLPIREFVDIMNDFLRHSKKEIEIDSVGKIVISHGGSSIPLTSLSSGEKQLLILLIHARFGLKKKSSFIVDEPELSLHMHWQEMLADSLLMDNNRVNQFIFATHSPEIVGFRVDKCIEVG